MELYQLKSFLAVVRTGSLSKAALPRNISLPGISKHIKMLEEEIGQPLFARTPKGMELTVKGRQVLPLAERIEREMDALTALCCKVVPLRIGLNIGPEFIELRSLKELLERCRPGSDVTLTNHNTGVLLDSLAKRDLDICLAFGTVPEHLTKLLIRNVRMILMVPVDFSEHPADLSRACWVINTANCPFKAPLEDFFRAHGITPQSTILAQDLSRKDLVAQGLGIGFLEPQDGLALVRKGLARRHGDSFLEVPLWVVYRDPAFREDAERLRDFIKKKYEALPSFSSTGDARMSPQPALSD